MSCYGLIYVRLYYGLLEVDVCFLHTRVVIISLELDLLQVFFVCADRRRLYSRFVFVRFVI